MRTKTLILSLALTSLSVGCATKSAISAGTNEPAERESQTTLPRPADARLWERTELPWLPLQFWRGYVPTSDLEVAGLPTRGASLDDALVEVVVVCEYGCSACRDFVRLIDEAVESVPSARLVVDNVIRYESSKAAPRLLERAHDSGRFWEAHDLLWGIGGRLAEVAAIERELGLAPADTLSADVLEHLDARVAAYESKPRHYWSSTPTVFVNGLAVGPETWSLAKTIGSQSAFAWQVHDETGLQGRALLDEVRVRNVAAAEIPRQRLARLSSQCEAGSAAACRAEGSALLDHRFGSFDVARAGERFRKNCDAGDELSCHANDFLNSSTSPARAIELCVAGIRIACAQAVEAAGALATFEILKTACDDGDVASCEQLLNYDRDEDVSSLCAEGAASACLALARSAPGPPEKKPWLLESLGGYSWADRTEIAYNLHRDPSLNDAERAFVQSLLRAECAELHMIDPSCQSWMEGRQ